MTNKVEIQFQPQKTVEYVEPMVISVFEKFGVGLEMKDNRVRVLKWDNAAYQYSTSAFYSPTSSVPLEVILAFADEYRKRSAEEGVNNDRR